MSVVVVSQDDPRQPAGLVQQRLRAMARTARAEGLRVVGLPRDVDLGSALAGRVGAGDRLFVSGVWDGEDAYRRIGDAAAATGARMCQPACRAGLVMRIDRWAGRIAGSTPDTVIVRGAGADLDAVFGRLGRPVFVKGLVKSRKERGLAACVASTPHELARHLGDLGGVAVARRLVDLRASGEIMGMPRAREYRFFLLAGLEAGHGYYWPGTDPFGPLDDDDLSECRRLCALAHRALDAPLLACDVAQLEDGSWTIVEVGDPQFSGVAHMPRELFWRALTAAFGCPAGRVDSRRAGRSVVRGPGGASRSRARSARRAPHA